MPKWTQADLIDLQMSTEAGRAFVYSILASSFFDPGSSKDANASLYDAGRRSYGAELWHLLVNRCPSELTLCLSEHFAEASSVRRRNKSTADSNPADANE